jgi:hypothetical protein
MANNQFTFTSVWERFFSHVTRGEGGCWLWRDTLRGGYARFTVGSRANKTTFSAHRFAYERLVGSIPEGLELDHLCRHRQCVNPWHLEPVTHLQNIQRGNSGKHQASRTHCPRGHPYDDTNTLYLPAGGRRKSANRMCRECNRARRRAYYYAVEKPLREQALN